MLECGLQQVVPSLSYTTGRVPPSQDTDSPVPLVHLSAYFADLAI